MKDVRKKYKALLLDLDGTTIPIEAHGLPSQKVEQAIITASKKICVGVATSRPYFLVSYIFDLLPLSSPCIINSGSEIMDPKTHTVLSQQVISPEDVIKVFEYAHELQLPVLIDFHEKYEEMIDVNLNLEGALCVYIPPVDEKKGELFLKRISPIATISAHKMPTPEKGKIHITINHVSATKQHGILQIAELLHIQTHDIIGVGDGLNDFPLLMACGLKVAMGNAPEELKAIADYVAPTVEEDGVADVIEKFIL